MNRAFERPDEDLLSGLHPEALFKTALSEDLIICDFLTGYEDFQLVGKGGMGTVFSARQCSFRNRRVAIKVLSNSLSKDPRFVDRFRKESEMMVGLKHQGIATVFDRGEVGDFVYYVMEFIDGKPLNAIIDKSSLAERTAFSLISQICDSVQYAHDKGIIHRDIKPSNILVTKDDDVEKAHLVDFGIAQLPEDSKETKVAIGTPQYMAPELSEGQPADARSDVYSIGMVFYEMLCGSPPGVLSEPVSKITQTDPRLDQIFSKALEQNPAKRFHKPSELREAIGQIQRSTRKGHSLWLVSGVAVTMIVILAVLFWPERNNTKVSPLDSSMGQSIKLEELPSKIVSGSDGFVLAKILPRTVVVGPVNEKQRAELQRLPKVRLTQPFFLGNQDQTNLAHEGSQDGLQATQTFITNPQCLQRPGGQWLTAKEMRLQAYTQLLYQVRCLMWYVVEGQPPFEASSSIGTEFQELVPELQQLESVLAEGKFTRIGNPDNPSHKSSRKQETWHAGHWEYQGNLYFIVVNTHKTAPQAIDVILPNVVDGAATLVFSNRRYGSGMFVEDSRLQGTIRGGDVHVYRIPMINTIREDGVLIVNGKPTFLLGIDQVGLEKGRYKNGVLVSDIETIAAAGFNFVHTNMDHTYDGHPEWGGETPARDACARATELGIHLGDSIYLENPDFLETEVSHFHEMHETIILSSIGYSFNWSPKDGITNDRASLNMAPDRMRAIHASVKAEAPNQFTYSSGLSLASANLVLEDYMEPRAMDLIAVQHYPIGSREFDPDYEWEAMDDLCESYWAQAGPQANKAFIAKPQCFRWPNSRWITAREMRLQAFTQVLHRVKGFVWHSFDGFNRQQPLPEANPLLWTEFQALIPELRQLESVLTDGEFTKIVNPDNPYYKNREQGTWHAGYWDYQEHLYVVVVNTHKKASQKINFALPNVVDGVAKLMFSKSRYGEGMLIENGRLRGKIKSGDVHVYRLPVKSDSLRLNLASGSDDELATENESSGYRFVLKYFSPDQESWVPLKTDEVEGDRHSFVHFCAGLSGYYRVDVHTR